MKEMSNVKTNATTESAGQFYTENRLSNRKNLNFISSYLRGIFWAIGAIVERGRHRGGYIPPVGETGGISPPVLPPIFSIFDLFFVQIFPISTHTDFFFCKK